jgi:hypothetical protein
MLHLAAGRREAAASRFVSWPSCQYMTLESDLYGLGWLLAMCGPAGDIVHRWSEAAHEKDDRTVGPALYGPQNGTWYDYHAGPAH